MTAERIIYTLLTGNAGLVALVGTRIYYDARPEDDPLPAIVYSSISDTPTPPIDSTTGLEPCTARLQINCLATTAAARQQLLEGVIAALHKQSGSIAGNTTQAVLQSTAGPSQYDALLGIYSLSVDFTVHYLR
jgi:hypothetical protein